MVLVFIIGYWTETFFPLFFYKAFSDILWEAHI